MRPAHDLSRYASGFLAGALGAASGLCGTVPSRCKQERRPLLDLLGVELGRICGSLARRLGLLAAVAPYELASQLAQLLLGVTISAMGVWRVVQRLGQAAASYSEALSQYHADSRSEGASVDHAPPAVVLGVDGCTLGMQVRTHRRRRLGAARLPALPVIEQGHFREVKTGVLLPPSERVETSPGHRSVVRRFLVTCLGEADEIFRRLYAQLRELGWLDPDHTVVVIVGGPRGYPAEWIWNRAPMFVHHCEILDFWHALEHAWTFARLRFRRGFRTGRPLGSSSCRRPAGRQGARGDRRLETPAA